MKKYIHYGHKEYNPLLFKEIKNVEHTKPLGGLWGSPLDSKNGWKEFCNNNIENYNDDSFIFTLKEGARIIHLYCKEDVMKLPIIRIVFNTIVFLDFEKIKDTGIDAIEVHINLDEADDSFEGLVCVLGGWDCDSILIINKEVIVVETANET